MNINPFYAQLKNQVLPTIFFSFIKSNTSVTGIFYVPTGSQNRRIFLTSLLVSQDWCTS